MRNAHMLYHVEFSQLHWKPRQNMNTLQDKVGEIQQVKSHSYTEFNTSWIFLELSDVWEVRSFMDVLSFVRSPSMLPSTGEGRKIWPIPIFLASTKLSEKFRRLATVIFAWPTTKSNVVEVLWWNFPCPSYKTMHPILDTFHKIERKKKKYITINWSRGTIKIHPWTKW